MITTILLIILVVLKANLLYFWHIEIFRAGNRVFIRAHVGQIDKKSFEAAALLKSPCAAVLIYILFALDAIITYRILIFHLMIQVYLAQGQVVICESEQFKRFILDNNNKYSAPF